MTPGEELIGWRLWRAQDGILYAWVANHAWAPGENVARCLALGRTRCAHPPGGEGCNCGFWGLRWPRRVLDLARARPELRGPFPRGRPVLGLVRGWGEVAIHGHEGFRAERASVVMLFSDLVGPRSLTPMRWWHGRRGRVLRDAAGRYGVPVLPLRTALDHRVLEELGLPRSAIAQAGQLVRPSQWWAGREFPAGLYGGEKP